MAQWPPKYATSVSLQSDIYWYVPIHAATMENCMEKSGRQYRCPNLIQDIICFKTHQLKKLYENQHFFLGSWLNEPNPTRLRAALSASRSGVARAPRPQRAREADEARQGPARKK